MIDNINSFLKIIKDNMDNNNSEIMNFRGKDFINGREVKLYSINDFNGELFCPKCGDIRKCISHEITNMRFYFYTDTKDIGFYNLPGLFKATCLQCDSETLLLLYQGPEGISFAVLHNTYSGCVTPNSPKEVKYYIDQAFRARSIGAVSAAMAMYRSALEWLLHDQGFTKGMLGEKIATLEDDVKNKTALKWAMDIDINYLIAIKNIGNGAIHTNSGDISKQNIIDKELLELVDVVFSELLDIIYEQPLRSASNLAILKNKVDSFKK